MKLYKILPSVLVALVLMCGISGVANAQTSSSVTNASVSAAGSPTSVVSSGPICFPFPVNIWYGATDSATQNGVTDLQDFLSQQGYFNSAYIGSGHFGPLTLQAVQKFQLANSLPSTGYVGPLTRALITRHCGVPTPTPSTLSINSVSPVQAPVGATVTIYGSDFTSNNTILMDGDVVAQNVAAIYPPTPTPIYNCPPGAMCATPATSNVSSADATFICPPGAMCSNPGNGSLNEMLTFTVPSSLSPNCPNDSVCPMYMRLVTPGQYTVTVQNSNGTSNAVNFTVGPTISSNPGPLTITGLDAPSSLAVGQTGTWTVHAMTSAGSGELHYSVDWGDNSAYPAAMMEPEAASVNTSSSFTHAYQTAGTYTATFTVSDDFGHSASTSSTITVSPTYY